MKEYNVTDKRILVIRLSSLGDVVLTTLLLRCLRARYRQATIDMLTKEQYLPILDEIYFLDNRLGYPETTTARRKLKRSLAQKGYDTVIDLQNNIISRSIVSAVNPEHVYKYTRARFNRWLRIHFPGLRKRLKTAPSIAEGYLATAAPMWVKDDRSGLELRVNPKSAQTMRESLRSYHAKAGLPFDMTPLAVAAGARHKTETVNDRSAQTMRELMHAYQKETGLHFNMEPFIIAPGARHNTKAWLPDHWVEFMKSAYAEGYLSQVLIGSADEDKLLETIRSQLDFPVLKTGSDIDLKELIALISLGCALVSNDSGPMHIAAAVRTPVVAIFGSTVPEFGFAPFRCSSEIVQVDGLACRPCHPHGRKRCPRKHFRCMEYVSPEMVLTALKRIAKVEQVAETSKVKG